MSIRWGVWFEPTQPVARLCELAVLAEGLGAEACFVADEGTERDTWIALTAILGATRSLTVAPAITNPFSRHPVTTAAAVATLHELHPGRVWQGLGVGGSRVLEPLQITEPRLYTALRDAFDVQRLLLAGETSGAASLPWFHGDIPIAIAGRGPRVQALAAARADWVILSGKAVKDLPAAAARIRAAGDAAIIWSSYVAWSEHERSRVLRHFSYMALDAPPDIREAAGLDDDRAAAVKAAMLAGDMDGAAHLLPDALIDIYAIAGTPAECAATIAANRDHFDLFMLPLNDEQSAEEHIVTGSQILAQTGSVSGIAE
jgi:5,10-methylenetetrahydromethanopterin reductase